MSPLATDRGLSPVVGVALLLGIVVLLGSLTFGAVAIGVDGALQQQTQAHLSAAPAPASGGSAAGITIAHEGGSSLQTDDITVRSADGRLERSLSEFVDRSELGAGDRVTLTADTLDGVEAGDRIVVRWTQQGQSLRMASATIGGSAGTGTATGTPECTDDDHDRGHGNDCDHDDEDNPGNGGPAPH